MSMKRHGIGSTSEGVSSQRQIAAGAVDREKFVRRGVKAVVVVMRLHEFATGGGDQPLGMACEKPPVEAWQTVEKLLPTPPSASPECTSRPDKV